MTIFSSYTATVAGKSTRKTGRSGGFSMIEVVMAIGVVSFAFVSILGLVPMGMNDFRSSIDCTVGAQISQRVVNEMRQTDYTTLLTATQPVRYFDVDGGTLTSASGAIYDVNTRVTQSPVLPGSSAGNENLATVTVQVANNPAGAALTVDPATNLWKSQPGVSMRVFSTVVSGYCTSGT